MYISIGDNERLSFVFNKRIMELRKLANENPDLKVEINEKINEYERTLIKYSQFKDKEEE